MAVRNYNRLEEQEPGERSRFGTWFLGAIAVALLVGVGVVGSPHQKDGQPSARDPLAELVQNARAAALPPPAEKLEGREVTFPSLLSDASKPTTALAAVKDERGRLVQQAPAAPAERVPSPPPATDRLSVVPLPAGSLMGQTSVTADPRDRLTRLAASASQSRATGELALPGTSGGFQLQVASFRKQGEADSLVEGLRRRGHHAFRLPTQVPDRGLWHRVRIGPFAMKSEAVKYKEHFEKAEHLTPHVVDPRRVLKLEEQQRQQTSR